MSGGHFLTTSQRCSTKVHRDAGSYFLITLRQVISGWLNVLSGSMLKYTRLNQPPRLDQTQSQRQRPGSMDHHFPLALSHLISICWKRSRRKLLLTTRLDQPPRLDQPQSQRQRLRNLDHRNTLFDQPQDQRKGATLVNPSSRTTRNGPSRPSRREIDAIKMQCGADGVKSGGRSPSISKERHLGQNGVEVFTTSACRLLRIAWLQTGSCGMPRTRQKK